MKRIIPILVVALCACACTEQTATTSPFTPPAGVIYETNDDIEFHSFRWGADETTALFMMNPHPAGLNQSMVDAMTRDSAVHLESALQEVEGVEVISTETRDFTAEDFTGKEIACKLRESDGSVVYAAMHILWDGTRLWQGQLTGTGADDLAMVRAILRSKE